MEDLNRLFKGILKQDMSAELRTMLMELAIMVDKMDKQCAINGVGKQSELVCELGAHEHNKSIFNLGQCHRCYKTKTIE